MFILFFSDISFTFLLSFFLSVFHILSLFLICFLVSSSFPNRCPFCILLLTVIYKNFIFIPVPIMLYLLSDHTRIVIFSFQIIFFLLFIFSLFSMFNLSVSLSFSHILTLLSTYIFDSLVICILIFRSYFLSKNLLCFSLKYLILITYLFFYSIPSLLHIFHRLLFPFSLTIFIIKINSYSTMSNNHNLYIFLLWYLLKIKMVSLPDNQTIFDYIYKNYYHNL